MRGVPLRGVRHKYLYRSGHYISQDKYIRYAFYVDGSKRSQGEVYRKGRNEKTWYARHYNYPSEEDVATGRTRDEAVDKLLALLGEG